MEKRLSQIEVQFEKSNKNKENNAHLSNKSKIILMQEKNKLTEILQSRDRDRTRLISKNNKQIEIIDLALE